MAGIFCLAFEFEKTPFPNLDSVQSGNLSLFIDRTSSFFRGSGCGSGIGGGSHGGSGSGKKYIEIPHQTKIQNEREPAIKNLKNDM